MAQVELDHLVIAAATLDEGEAYVRQRLGVSTQIGGKHERMGTHNRLLRLGARAYLEVIAIDPHALAPSRPRWFDLDNWNVSAPRLIHFVARTDDIYAAVAQCATPLGAITPMARGAFEWLITIPDDGKLPMGGVVPTLIQWQRGGHPTERLVESGCELMSLRVTHPQPDVARHALHSVGLAQIEVSASAIPQVRARLNTPNGIVEL